MKRRVLSISIRAMFQPLGVVAGPDYQAPQWPIFPVAWPTPEPELTGRPVRVRWPGPPNDELFDFNALIGPSEPQAQTIVLGAWFDSDDIWARSPMSI